MRYIESTQSTVDLTESCRSNVAPFAFLGVTKLYKWIGYQRTRKSHLHALTSSMRLKWLVVSQSTCLSKDKTRYKPAATPREKQLNQHELRDLGTF